MRNPKFVQIGRKGAPGEYVKYKVSLFNFYFSFFPRTRLLK